MVAHNNLLIIKVQRENERDLVTKTERAHTAAALAHVIEKPRTYTRTNTKTQEHCLYAQTFISLFVMTVT